VRRKEKVLILKLSNFKLNLQIRLDGDPRLCLKACYTPKTISTWKKNIFKLFWILLRSVINVGNLVLNFHHMSNPCHGDALQHARGRPHVEFVCDKQIHWFLRICYEFGITYVNLHIMVSIWDIFDVVSTPSSYGRKIKLFYTGQLILEQISNYAVVF
jgi:hypothetical protein